MKEILRQYGGVMICGLVLILLMAFWNEPGKGGLSSRLGQLFSGMQQDTDSGENEAFTSYMDARSPVITQQQTYLKAGEETLLEDCVSAAADGDPATVRILQIYDEDQEPIETESEAVLRFPQSGVRYVCVEAQSSRGKTATALLTFLINP